MADLKLFLFGPPRIELDGMPVEVQRRKALALLVYLAVSGQPHSRDALATLFWPDQSQQRARAYLRRDLAVLNTSLAGDWLLADRDTVELKHRAGRSTNSNQLLWLDVDHFRRLLAACQSHGHSPEDVCSECLSRLTEAAALYADDFLAGFTLRDSPAFDEWQFFETESLRQDLAVILKRLVQGHSAQAKYNSAIPYARRWLALDPLHEPAQYHLIQLYDQAGQPAAALRQYEEYVELLEEELGLPPEEETTTLYEAIKAKRMLGSFIKAEEQERKPAGKPETKAAETPEADLLPAPGPHPASPRPLPPSASFIGRKSEYEQLVTAIDRACQSLGQVVLIEGEPGIGKSRLAQEAMGYAGRQKVNVLYQKCYQAEQTMPYQALIDLVTQILAGWPAGTFSHIPPPSLAELAQLAPEITTIFPTLPALPDTLAEARQARLFRVLNQFVVAPAIAGPLMLVIDDIQWADPVTLQFLQHLAHHLTRQPVLLVCTYRTAEAATDAHLAASLRSLQRESHVIHLPLSRLSLQDAHSLVESLSAGPHAAVLAEWLYRETDGNPFFLMSILQSLREQGILTVDPDAGGDLNLQRLQAADTRLTLPDALRQSVQDRLRRVPPSAQHLLEVMAVYGRRFDFEALQAITGEELAGLLETIEELIARQLLREEREDRTYDFDHDKIREVVYHDLSKIRRVLLHRQVAEALEASHADRVGMLAEHFDRGEVWDKAITYLARAGGHARQLFAMEEALGFYDRALTLAQQHPEVVSHSLLLDLYQQRGETRGLIGGHVKEAVADLQVVLEAAQQSGDRERERVALIRTGQVYRFGDRYDEALDYLKAALAVARQGEDESSVADVLYHLGTTVWSQGRNDQALAYHQEAVEICQRLGLTGLVAVQAYHGLGEAYFLAGQPEQAINLYEQSLTLARQIQDKGYESENLGNMGMAMQVYGLADYHRAIEAFSAALKISQLAHLEWHSTQILGPLGLAYGLRGNYRQGLEYLHRSLRIADSIGARRFHSLLLDMLGTIWQELNLPEQAKTAHQQALELAQQADAGWWLPRIQANLAIDRLRLGDLEVGESLRATFKQAMDRRLEIHAVRCLEGLAELALAQGKPQQALEHAGRLLQLAGAGGLREVMAQAHRWQGEAWLALGKWEQAVAALEQSLAILAKVGRPRLEWDLHAALARLYRAQAHEEAALQHEAQMRRIVVAGNWQDPAIQRELSAVWEPGQPPEQETIPAEISNRAADKTDKPDLPFGPARPKFISEKLIATGGMGEVYQGRDTATGQRVAIKRLKPELMAQNPEAIKRLMREAEVLHQLNHPNIVKLLATLETEGRPMIVMEYVSGGSLRALLDQHSQLPLDRVLNIALELADALARAHHLNIIHRDLKPDNVLLAEDGSPRLTDFGVAYLARQETRLTQEGAILGTTVYISPEAWRGGELDARSDIWSFGAMLYEMLAGRPPFAAEQIAAIITAILNDPVPDLYQFRPDLPPGLVELIKQMLVKERALRLDSMRQVAAGLELIQRSTRIRPA